MEAGVYLVGNETGSQFFVMGHSEYDADTLPEGVYRDLNKGMNPEIPSIISLTTTRKGAGADMALHGMLIYSNWLNYFVYRADTLRIVKEER